MEMDLQSASRSFALLVANEDDGDSLVMVSLDGVVSYYVRIHVWIFLIAQNVTATFFSVPFLIARDGSSSSLASCDSYSIRSYK